MFPGISYQGIDAERTGMRLKELIKQSGYSVGDIQKLLHMSCPQPVYKWMKGQMLPTVEHLYALAKIFHVHMEEILVPRYLLGDNVTLHKAGLEWNRLLADWRCRGENTTKWREEKLYERLD